MTNLNDDIILEIGVSPMKRWVAVAAIGFSGIFLLWVSATQDAGSAGGRLALAAIGLAALWGAMRFHRSGSGGLILTETALYNRNGFVLCQIVDIRSVERGLLVARPSGGFTIRLKRAMPRGWQPGLWWRFGHRVGVGGAISQAEGKAMADSLMMLVATRDGLIDKILDHKPLER